MKSNAMLNALVSAFFFLLSACEKDAPPIPAEFSEKSIDILNRGLMSYKTNADKKYLVIFDSGLGDDGSVWFEKNIPEQVAEIADVAVYDRAGYGKSAIADHPRDIPHLRQDLEKLVEALAGNRKVVLVAHSLGGMVIRDYAVHHQDKVAALLFVDPSHEDYNNPSQEIEDMIYESFKAAYGEHFGGTMEARELVEDAQYMTTLDKLPNVPTVVLTSVKVTPGNPAEDRLQWFDAHEKLGKGVSDFKHVPVDDSGHYIQREQPAIVLEYLKGLLDKI